MIWLLGCVNQDLTVEPGLIDTVLTISWESVSPTQAHIEFTDGRGNSRVTPAESEPGTEHRLVLAGLPAGSAGTWRTVEVDALGNEERGPVQIWTTGLAPLDLNHLKPVEDVEYDGYILTIIEPYMAVVIYDGMGDPVWWFPIPEGRYSSQTWFHDQTLYFDSFTRLDTEPDTDFVHQVTLDQLSNEVVEVQGHHHDFRVTEEGIFYLARDIQTGPTGEPWVGDKVMQLTPEGEYVQRWSTWDYVDFSMIGGDFYSDGQDWTHCNGVEPYGDLLLISCKIQRTLFAVDPAGEVVWAIGGHQETLPLKSGTRFQLLHRPFVQDDTIFLFDNGDAARDSRALQIQVNPDKNWSIDWTYAHDGWQSLAHGNVEPQGDLTMVAFGQSGQLDILQGDERVGSYQGPVMNYTHLIPSLGGPVTD